MSSTLGVSEPVRHYVQRFGVREHPVLGRCRKATADHPRVRMQISPEQGAFLRTMVFAVRARTMLEVGVFTGYSSLVLALAAREIHGSSARLVACDLSAEYLGIARGFWEEAAVQDIVDARLGPAAATLDALLASGAEGTFDLAFVDADKTGYSGYYEQCVRLLRPSGLLLVDNMLWGGAVAEEGEPSADTLALRALAARIHDDPRVEMTLATVGDGLSIVVKR